MDRDVEAQGTGHGAGEQLEERDALRAFQAVSDRIVQLVPDCVGMSVAFLEAGVAFTLMATDTDIAVLDGVQYVDGGPCVDTLDTSTVFEAHPRDDATDSSRWPLFSDACAVRAVASTLTVPLLRDGEVRGSLNVYAATTEAFDGRHEALTSIVDAWAPTAIGTAGHLLTIRTASQRTPSRPQARATIDAAIDLLQERQQADRDVTGHRLRWAATRAGLDEADLAAFIVEVHHA